MLLTKASEYAFLGLICIANNDGVSKDVDTISTELQISKSFLAKILQNLAKVGVLKSFKGVNGGFALAKHPRDISVRAILDAVESKKTQIFDCGGSTSKMCEEYRKMGCNICGAFRSLQQKTDEFLDCVTLADLIDEKRKEKSEL